MLRQCGKTVGGGLVVLWLVATWAVAAEMTYTASDGKGNCTAAVGADGKVGDKMACVDKGTVIACTAQASPGG
jgi:hypothetical protein